MTEKLIELQKLYIYAKTQDEFGYEIPEEICEKIEELEAEVAAELHAKIESDLRSMFIGIGVDMRFAVNVFTNGKIEVEMLTLADILDTDDDDDEDDDDDDDIEDDDDEDDDEDDDDEDDDDEDDDDEDDDDEDDDDEDRPRRTQSKQTNLRVIMDDGRVFESKHAAHTFANVIGAFGILEVRDLGILIAGNNIISKEPFEGRGHVKLGNFYVYTNLSNSYKKSILEEIAERLGRSIKIEIFKKNNGRDQNEPLVSLFNEK